MNSKSKKKVPTLISMLVLLRLGLLFFMLVFLLSSLWFVRKSQTQQLIREELASIEQDVFEIRSELEQHEAILSEFYGETLERDELYREDSQIQYFGKNETITFLSRIQKYNPEIGVLFVRQLDGFLIMSHMPGTGSTFEPRNWIDTQVKSPDLSLENRWFYLSLEEDNYLCFMTYDESHRLLAGNLIPVSELFSSMKNAVLVPHFFEILDDGNTVWSYGEEVSRTGFSYEYPLADRLGIRGQVGRSDYNFLQLVPLTVLLVAFFFLIAFAIESRIIYTRYAKPMMVLTDAVVAAEKDPEHAQIEEDHSTQEMEKLTGSIRHLAEEVLVRRMAAYEHQLKEQDMELIMLRSQLRPHFYLNALTTIDAMTYQNRNEDIRQFLQALSVHIRYMLRTDESKITLGEEIRHIEAYLAMQEIRHPGKIVHLFDVSDELFDIEIPHLILYTVVENSFKYAFGSEDTLLLMIHGTEIKESDNAPIPSGIRIRIEDNGNGYPEEILQQFSSDSAEAPKSRGHIGLSNVRRTMELWYGKKNLMRLHNSHMGGAVTELFFPLTRDSERITRSKNETLVEQ